MPLHSSYEPDRKECTGKTDSQQRCLKMLQVAAKDWKNALPHMEGKGRTREKSWSGNRRKIGRVCYQSHQAESPQHGLLQEVKIQESVTNHVQWLNTTDRCAGSMHYWWCVNSSSPAQYNWSLPNFVICPLSVKTTQLSIKMTLHGFESPHLWLLTCQTCYCSSNNHNLNLGRFSCLSLGKTPWEYVFLPFSFWTSAFLAVTIQIEETQTSI